MKNSYVNAGEEALEGETTQSQMEEQQRYRASRSVYSYSKYILSALLFSLLIHFNILFYMNNLFLLYVESGVSRASKASYKERVAEEK